MPSPDAGIRDLGSDLTDIIGRTPPLYAYAIWLPTGVTLRGYFVDTAGVQIPGSFSTATGAGLGSAITLRALYTTSAAQGSVPWPANIGEAQRTSIVGFVGVLSANAYIGIGGQVDGTIPTVDTPATTYPVASSSQNLILGRVA